MIVTRKLKLDLLGSGDAPIVDVIQDDRYSRNLELSLFAGGDAWPVPENTDVLIRYHKPDETVGKYNLLPDGTSAWHSKGNILTIALTPQMLTVPGDVMLTVVLTLKQKQISTPRIIIRVSRSLTVENTDSESYYNVAHETIKAALGFVPVDRNRISIGLDTDDFLRLFIDGAPVGLGVALTEQDDDAIHYTVQSLTDAQKEQARENIGAVSAGEVGEAIAEAIAEKTQIEHNFASSIEECTDTSKVYVLPDGYIYGYMYATSEPPEITIETTSGGYWGKNEAWLADETKEANRTNIIPVTAGDKLEYTGVGIWNAYSCYFYDADMTIISQDQINDGSTMAAVTTEVTVPDGAEYARFASFFNIGGGKLEVSWVLCQGAVTDYQWVSTGHAFVQADYEDRVIELESVSDEHATEIAALSEQMDSVKESLKSNGEVEITYEYGTGGYWNKSGAWTENSGSYCKRTNLIPVSSGDKFVYTGCGIYNIPSAIWFNDSESVLACEQYNNGGAVTTATLTAPSGAAYVRFYSHSFSSDVTLVITQITNNYEIELLKAGNCLYGKKYVACGDSFTEGDFTGIGKTEETWSDEFQTYKTYPYWIASRNRMTLVNEAICGTTMHNNGSADAFSVTRYTEIPEDADYITLCFGLNETSAEIGTLNDTTNETVMGAWNVVLEYLITNHPYAKIGIIIPDSWCTEALRNALISVARYWGIPWLDTKGDPKVSLMMGGRYSDVALSPKAQELRDASFRVSDTNSHPNAKAHEYRSTVIENFLRSL